MSRAVPCSCGHPTGKHWHVSPEADIQGVCFTKEEAEAVAKLINQGIIEMRLCETKRVILKPGQLYNFTVDLNCKECRKLWHMSLTSSSHKETS